MDSCQRRWTALELALAASLVITVLLIGTEAGRLLTVVRAMGACIGALLIVAYILNAPREHDVVDGLVLAGLVAFLVTCVTSSIPRSSFEAATTAVAYTAAFFVARGAVAGARGRDLAILTLGILGTILSLILLVAWASVWIDWMSIVGAGLPPLDLTLPSAPFTGIHVAILIGLLTPATLLLSRRPRIWPVGMVGSAASFALILMSGSRSVWLGVAAALVVAVVLGGGRRLLRIRRPILAAGAVAAVAALVVVGPQLLGRLATGSTIELRLAMWSETIGRSMEAPILGFGPGTFPAQFHLTEYYNSFEPWTGHAHNALIQLMLEGGIIGLLGIGLIGCAVIAGIRQRGRIEWAPGAAIAFMVAVSATENPTVSSYLVMPFIVWAALAVPRRRRDATTVPHLWLSRAHVLLAAVVGLAVTATLVASWSYDQASVAADAGNNDKVVSALTTAVNVDPALSFYRRELGVWLLADGDLEAAATQLRRALELNPADQTALRTWALLGLATGDPARALQAAAEAQSRADLHVENALTLAYVGLATGDDEAAWTGLVRAVRLNPWLLSAPEWDVVFPQVDKAAILAAARDSWADSPDASARNLRARTWLNAMTGTATPAEADVALETEAALIGCDREAAIAALGQLTGEQAADLTALEARLMYERIFGGSDGSKLIALIAAHDQGIRREATVAIAGTSAAGDHNRDVNTYSRIPIRPPIGPTLPTLASGMSAWLRDPVAAADLGAPGSPLAACR